VSELVEQGDLTDTAFKNLLDMAAEVSIFALDTSKKMFEDEFPDYLSRNPEWLESYNRIRADLVAIRDKDIDQKTAICNASIDLLNQTTEIIVAIHERSQVVLN
jgi:hypothetical protein